MNCHHSPMWRHLASSWRFPRYFTYHFTQWPLLCGENFLDLQWFWNIHPTHLRNHRLVHGESPAQLQWHLEPLKDGEADMNDLLSEVNCFKPGKREDFKTSWSSHSPINLHGRPAVFGPPLESLWSLSLNKLMHTNTSVDQLLKDRATATTNIPC